MGNKPKQGGKTSKTNVTGRERAPETKRNLILVFESYRKSNGALGLRRYWQEI